MTDGAHLVVHAGVTEPPPAQTLALAPAVRAPVANGPRVRRGGVVPPTIAAFVYRPYDIGLGSPYPPAFHRPSAITDLPNSWERTWQDRLNEEGSGSLSIANDDADLADVHDGDLVRFELHGEAAMSWFVADREKVTIAEGEELDEVTKLSGPGHISILAQSLVYPVRAPIVWPPPDYRRVGGQPIEEDRTFSWASVNYGDGDWATATEYAEIHDVTPAWTGLIGAWPGDTAYWIWAGGYSTSWAPSGTCYFRKQFTLAEATKVVIFAAADDSLRLYLDGALVVARDAWYNTGADVQTVTADLDAGTHCIAAACGNSSLGIPLAFNPSAFACLAYTVDVAGNFTSLLARSDNTWLIVPYPPEPPSVTAGEVILEVLGEVNTRRGHPTVAAAFTLDTDSDGRPWDPIAEIGTKVGNDVLTFLKEMASTYIDFWMDPGGYLLWAWNKDRRGVTRSVALHAPTDPTDPTSGNLAGLVHHRVT